MWSLSQSSASGQVDTIFPRLGLFSRHSLHLLTYRRTSWLMPGHQAIIRTAVSVAFLPARVSWALAITMSLSLGGMKGTTPRKIFLLWMVKASFCCSILSLLLSTVSRRNLIFFWWHLGRIYSIPAQFWCLTGSPGRIGRSRYCQEQSRLDQCHRRRQSLVCSKQQRGRSVLRVYISIRSQIPSALSPIS